MNETNTRDVPCCAFVFPDAKFLFGFNSLQSKTKLISELKLLIELQEKDINSNENITNFSGDFLKPSKKYGYLYKQGNSLLGLWRKRYFKLKGKTVFYFRSKSDTVPLGSICLKFQGHNAYEIVITKSGLGLELRPTKFAPSDRTFFLNGTDKATILDWFQLLTEKKINLKFELFLGLIFKFIFVPFLKLKI